MTSKAKTVSDYLDELPEDRREAIEAVRKVILDNLDRDYEEGMQYGMISYYVPHRIHPAGYHCDPKQPLPFTLLASQKNYMSIYMMCIYGNTPVTQWFRKEWEKTGKKMDWGKSCIRFKKLDDLPLALIGQAIARVPAKKYVSVCETLMREYREKPKSGTQKRATRKRTRATSGSRAKSRI